MMLLGSDCNLSITVDFRLYFDDGTSKIENFEKGSKVAVRYFSEATEKMEEVVGVISDIEIRLNKIIISRDFIPSNEDDTNIGNNIIPSSAITITVDSSKDFEVETRKFVLSELLGFTIIHDEVYPDDEPTIDDSDLIKPVEPIIPPDEYIEVEIKEEDKNIEEDNDMINVESIEGSTLPINPSETIIPEEEERQSVTPVGKEETPTEKVEESVEEKVESETVSVIQEKVQEAPRVTKIVINRL